MKRNVNFKVQSSGTERANLASPEDCRKIHAAQSEN
jgi:hypothetical protein